MSVVFDANILIDLFNENLKGEKRTKLDFLVQNLIRSRTKVIIPTPSLTELLVRADKARERYLQKISSTSAFQSLLLIAAQHWNARFCSRPHGQNPNNARFPTQNSSFDWQIVAIATSRGATAIYSDDGDIERAAIRANSGL